MGKIDRIIQKYKYVSFDVFDTLIKRSVAQPSDLFRLIEIQYNKTDYVKKRIQAEHIAWEKRKCPVTLAEIYAQMDETYHLMMDLEIEMEEAGCCASFKGSDFFRRCVDAGKTVVLISDMYLPPETIEAMLKKCGIIGYKKLYVSCEYRANKRSGDLYRTVLKDLEILPGQLVHIGDNIKADVLRPLSMGIGAVWLRNDQKRMCHIPSFISADSELMQRTVQACVRNASMGLDDVEKYGCTVFGPLLYGFTVWLAEFLKRDDIHDVYFLAREGLIMKRAFDELQISGIKTHYLYGSRRAFIVPILWKHIEFEEMFRFFNFGTRSLKALLECWGLDAEKYKQMVSDYNLDLNMILSREDYYNSDGVRAFYKAVQPDIRKNSLREYEAMLAYIKSLNMDRRIAIVDIGYNGSAQYAFTNFLRDASFDIEVKGYYIGILEGMRQYQKESMKAVSYLFDLDHHISYGDEIQWFMPVFEALFLALHGSVKRFIQKEKRGIPELYDFEYETEEGKIINEQKFIGGIQNGGIAFIKYMRQAFQGGSLKIQPDTAFYPVRRVGMNPKLFEARQWGNVRCFNYGPVRRIAKPRSIMFYIGNPCAFFADCRQTTWNIGFMKRLLRIPLPYDRIEAIHRKLVNLIKRRDEY